MHRFFLVLVLAVWLSGCGWFAPSSPELSAEVESQAAPTFSATTPPSTATLLTPSATQTRPLLSTPTPTLRPIAISLLPLPTAATAPLPVQRPITGAPQPVVGVPVTTAITPARLPLPEIAPTPDGVTRTLQVPILMYHYLSEPPAGADIYRRDLSVTPARFAAHLTYLQSAGYTAISLYDLVSALNQGTPLPPHPVILTFDDGYRDNYTNAFPLLKAQGMTATFFIVTDFIDEQRPEYVTWEMVREMYAAGMSIEAHGRNHVRLRGKDKDYLIWQALGSAETIQAELGVRPRFICYPSGEYDQLTIDIFQSAHYWAGLTTVQGATHSSEDLFELHRVRVRGTTTVEELRRLLELDW